MMRAAIALSQVTVKAGRTTVLRNVSFSIAPGEIVAVVGPNGAGKSTLMRVLSGDRAPDTGEAKLFGEPIARMQPAHLARRRAMLSQHVQVTFPFSVSEIVAMGAYLMPAREVQALVRRALDEVELTDFADRDITTLSGGEQQRAHFARVLVQLGCAEAHGDPGILLLDEPTSSLDLRHQMILIASARRRAERGTAVVAVLHDLNLAAAFAPRLLMLHLGNCVADGPPSAAVTPERLRTVFGVDLVETDTAALCSISPHNLRPVIRPAPPNTATIC